MSSLYQRRLARSCVLFSICAYDQFFFSDGFSGVLQYLQMAVFTRIEILNHDLNIA